MEFISSLQVVLVRVWLWETVLMQKTILPTKSQYFSLVVAHIGVRRAPQISYREALLP